MIALKQKLIIKLRKQPLTMAYTIVKDGKFFSHMVKEWVKPFQKSSIFDIMTDMETKEFLNDRGVAKL